MRRKPARRRSKKNEVKSPLDKKKAAIWLGLLLVVVLVFFLVRYFIGQTENYFNLAEAQDSGDIKVSYVDLTTKEIYTVLIPKDTEVNLGMRRGVLRASSVKKIIDSEDVGGQFLADTVTKTFHFPIDYWKSGASSDMPLMLRLRLRLSELSGMDYQEINLEDTSYLTPTKLEDGEEGYIVRDTMPLALQSVFADPVFSDEQLAVQLVNKTGYDSYYLSNVVKVLEVIGVKVAPIKDEDEISDGCVAKSLDKFAVKRIANVLDCRVEIVEPSAFDIEIILGREFYERF